MFQKGTGHCEESRNAFIHTSLCKYQFNDVSSKRTEIASYWEAVAARYGRVDRQVTYKSVKFLIANVTSCYGRILSNDFMTL